MKTKQILFIMSFFVLVSCEEDNPAVDDLFFFDSRDSLKYACVTIGSQVWMAENLAWIPELNKQDPKSMYYIYGIENLASEDVRHSDIYMTYGVLYSFEMALVACPPGWNLPTDEDWSKLGKFLGPKAGHFMKSEGFWTKTKESDECGFSALPAGKLDDEEGFVELGQKTYYWSSSSWLPGYAWIREIEDGSDLLIRSAHLTNEAFSVRCIKSK